MTNTADVVQGFMKAMEEGDFAQARGFLADRFSFQGPIDTFNRPEQYLESLKKLQGIIERVEMKKVFVDGDDACLLYDMVTRTPVGTAFIAEWHRVKGGKIAEIRPAFDARPFATMFAK